MAHKSLFMIKAVLKNSFKILFVYDQNSFKIPVSAIVSNIGAS